MWSDIFSKFIIFTLLLQWWHLTFIVAWHLSDSEDDQLTIQPPFASGARSEASSAAAPCPSWGWPTCGIILSVGHLSHHQTKGEVLNLNVGDCPTDPLAPPVLCVCFVPEVVWSAANSLLLLQWHSGCDTSDPIVASRNPQKHNAWQNIWSHKKTEGKRVI